MFKDKIEALLAENEIPQEQNFCSTGNIIEGSFDAESRTAKLVVIEKGWSLNGAYYSQTAIESIANHLNAGAARNVYLDHNEKKELFKPRKVADRIAVNVSAVVEGGQVIAKAKFFDTGPNKWVFDRMVEDKTGFGPSITGKAKFKQGEAEGRKGPIIEDVSFLNSYDIVDSPAAGGSIASVSEQFDDKHSLTFVMNNELKEDKPVYEAESLAGRINKIKTSKKARDEFNSLRWLFMDMIDDLISARNEFAGVSVKDRKSAIGVLFKEFEKEVGKLQLSEPLKITKKSEQVENEIKEVIEELILPKGEKEMEIKSLNDLKTNTALYEAILAEAHKINDVSGQVEAWKKDSDELKEVNTKLSESEQKVSDLTEAEKTSQKEIKDLKESVEKFESGVKEHQIKTIIEDIKKEAGLSEENCSEQFNSDLEVIVFEDEDKFKEAIKLRIDDRVSLIKESGTSKNKVNGAGPTAPKKGTEVVESTIPSAEVLAKKLKN